MGDVKAFVTKWCAGHDSGTLGPKIRADLESLLAAERAAATAAAVGACVKAIDYTAPGVDPATHEEAIEIDTVRACVASIRALSPEGWCAVKRDDLDVLMRTFPHVSARCDCTLQYADECAQECVDFDEVIDRIRAALARGKGE